MTENIGMSSDLDKRYYRPQAKFIGVLIGDSILSTSSTGNESIGVSDNSYSNDDFDQE